MNKILIRLGGAIDLLFVVFSLAMVQPIGTALSSLSPDIRASVSTWNMQVGFILLVFGCVALFRWRDLLTTRLGNIVAVAIALFWLLRAACQAAFFGLTADDMPMLGLCLLLALLHLAPALLEWKNAPGEAPQPSEKLMEFLSRPQEQVGRAPWTSYVIVAWCVVFGGLHLYWALGGNAGFAGFSTPASRELALTRAPIYMAITWSVVLACAFGAIVALAPFQGWTRRIPGWLMLLPLWVAAGLLLVRGVGNPVQSALIMGGGWAFDPLSGAEAQAWYDWMRMDAMFFSPWFILGGLAFGATAWAAHRHGAAAA